MLTNYRQKCESKVKNWIADNTKEGFKHLHKDNILQNLSLQDYQEFVLDCKMEITHTLDVECFQVELAGSVDTQGEFVQSQAEYEQAIKNHIDNEANNPKYLKILADTIGQENKYVKNQQKRVLVDIANILYEHTCHTCNGNTEQKCTYCMGRGEVRCGRCNGKGEYRCRSCEGRGEVKCNRCEGSGDCDRCGGKGYIRENMCSRCDGRGKCRKCNGKGTKWCSDYDCKGGFVRCPNCRGGFRRCQECNGTTIIKCKICEGTNKITQVAKISIMTTPKYTQSHAGNVDEQSKQIIEKCVKNDEIYEVANIVRTELKKDEKQKCLVETYQIQVPFAKFNLSFEDKTFAWLIYGKNLESKENKSVQEEMLQAFNDYETQKNPFKKWTKRIMDFWKDDTFKGKIKKALLYAVIMMVIVAFLYSDTEILGNYNFSRAQYGSVVENGTASAKGNWYWEQALNEHYIKLDDESFSISVDCSVFTGSYVIKNRRKKDNTETGFMFLGEDISTQKPKSKCEAQIAEIERQVIKKMFSPNNKLVYVYNIDSKQITIQLRENDKYYSILAIKEQE